MLDSGNFEKDLEKGKEVEHEVADLLTGIVPVSLEFRVIDGKVKGFDVYCLVEVKAEVDSIVNFFFETMWNGQPSGLTTTKARTWAVVDKTEVYFICLEELRNYIAEKKVEEKYYAELGNKGYSIRKDEVRHIPGTVVMKRFGIK